jgi:hypothetical protein
MTQEHPYKKEYLEAPLRMHKFKLECLHKRVALMPEGKTDYERNEVILEKIKTGAEIKALTGIIAEREAYYNNYFNNVFIKDIEDLENNFGEIITVAQKRTEPEIKVLVDKLLFAIKGSVNIELKIHDFKMLKKLLK